MSQEEYSTFCNQHVGNCARKFPYDVNKIANCLTTLMREHYGTSYDDRIGYSVAQQVAAMYY